MGVHLRQRVLPVVRFLSTALLLGLCSAVALQWLAPSWWWAAVGAGFAVWVRLYGPVPWRQAGAIWFGQALALFATRGFHGFPGAVLFSAPLPVWAILLPLVPRFVSPLWVQVVDRLEAGQRRWATPALTIGLPVVLTGAGAQLGHGLEFAAFGVASATVVSHSAAAISHRALWLALGGLAALAVHFAMIGVFGAITFMPYETALFLLPQVAGFVTWSLAGTGPFPASHSER